jgi:ABC-type antimicrobial peptide transport system permease subunit
MFRPGSNEIVVGSALQGHFQGLEIGENVHFGQRNWLVVGRIDAGGSGFDSEIWLDSEQLMQTFRRNAYSSVVVRLSDAADLDQVKSRIEGDPRLTLEVKSERSFYEDQSRVLSGFIRFLGITLSFLFSLGAIIGATITMYGSIASRKSEIGVMRALGFRRRNILFAFLTESMLLGLLGWLAGMGLASLMMRVKITTLNWTSYSELAFQFMLTPTIVLQSLVFSLMMGLIGGFLPAFKAANLNIVAALRAH